MCCRPDYEACTALAERTLDSSDCGAAHCVLGAPQPATSGEFIALAGETPLLRTYAVMMPDQVCPQAYDSHLWQARRRVMGALRMLSTNRWQRGRHVMQVFLWCTTSLGCHPPPAWRI